ncbi:4 TM domain-containing transmembrane protein [Acrasis kona]|uniref:4 TM domain-containing transmembrane protein n=1 Tax=Acrasis kona TaxID=1008807 RepID=A0AAW2ZQ93_9EUKA
MLPFLPFSFRCFMASLSFFNCNIYAGYHSYKSLQSHDLTQTSRWLMYWVVIAIFVLFENLFEVVLLNIVPFYPEIKFYGLLGLVINPFSPTHFVFEIVIPASKAYGVEDQIIKVSALALRYSTTVMAHIFKKLVEKSSHLSALSPEYLAELAKELSDMSFSVSHARNKLAKIGRRSLGGVDATTPRDSMTLRKPIRIH